MTYVRCIQSSSLAGKIKGVSCIYYLEFPVSYKYYPGQIELSLKACVNDINDKLEHCC